MVDFRQLLSKPLDSVKRPPAYPAGTYFGTIVSHKFDESPWADKTTGLKEPQVIFSIRLTQHGEDVDDADFAAAGGAGKLVSRAFPLDGENVWATKTFLEGLGIATAGRTFDTTIPETTGVSVMFELTQRPDKNNPERVFNDCRNVRAAS